MLWHEAGCRKDVPNQNLAIYRKLCRQETKIMFRVSQKGRRNVIKVVIRYCRRQHWLLKLNPNVNKQT